MQLPKLKKVTESKKKKILLLSDDLRMSSGVGTMSREIVIGTLNKYDWVQVGGAIKHPDQGKIIDMDSEVRKQTGVEDASLKIYPRWLFITEISESQSWFVRIWWWVPKENFGIWQFRRKWFKILRGCNAITKIKKGYRK